jgi:hypothetical protein
MALFSLNMLAMAIELALHDESYKDMAVKFVQHFVSIASATIHAGGNTGMWDEEDGFFSDVIQLPGGHAQRLKVRSMVGLLPCVPSRPSTTNFGRNILKSWNASMTSSGRGQN